MCADARLELLKVTAPTAIGTMSYVPLGLGDDFGMRAFLAQSIPFSFKQLSFNLVDLETMLDFGQSVFEVRRKGDEWGGLEL